MKKNVMMRVASALLVAVLLTTCAISGTFAKYVTDGTTTDTARVAKWGVTIVGKTGDTSAENTMFNLTYDTDEDDGYTGDITVEATVNVVAPGTTGTLSEFDISGQPEVAVRVTYEPELTLTNWGWNEESNGTPVVLTPVEYCPIIFTVNNEDYYVGKGNIADVRALETAVIAAIRARTADYAPGTDLSDVEDDLAGSWRWDFDGVGIPDGLTQTDIQDTKLGDLAADNDDSNDPKIEISVKCIITQID